MSSFSQREPSSADVAAPGKHASRALPLLAFCLVLLTGCVYSIQPWYAEGDGGADKTLLGVWQEAGGEDTWVFLAAGDSLRLVYRDDGQLGEFTAITFRHGDWNFLDLTPAGQSLGSGTAAWYMLPLHGVQAWIARGDTLELRGLDPNALSRLMETASHPPVDRREDNKWVFMGSREEMTAWVGAALLDTSLYSEQTVLVRR